MAKRQNAVVAVLVTDNHGKLLASGSGFTASAHGVIVTGCAIISEWLAHEESTLSIRTGSGETFPLDVVISKKCEDHIALIKIEAEGLEKAPLAADYKPKKGEAVFAGSPSGPGIALSDGVVEKIRAKDGSLLLDIPSTPGMDGSPVFNAKGEVIGIAVASPSKKQETLSAIPAGNIAAQLRKYGKLIKIIPKLPQPAAPAAAPPTVPPTVEQDNAETYFLLGSSYERSHRYRDAAEAYKKALQSKPDHTEAHMGLGRAYYKLGRYADAAEAYRQVLACKPGEITAYRRLGAMYIILGDYPKALEVLKQAVKLNPGDPELHFSLGIACLLSDDRQGAIREYTILRGLDEERARSMLDLIY
ncbi:MAG TPA: tetratricopeptide repeat-containing serine protease family protein [Dissulfurispiraceae bacterium]